MAIVFLIWLLNGVPCFASVSAADSPFVWWRPGEGRRLTDGRFEQVITLEVSTMFAVEQPEVWLRIRTGGGRKWQKGNWSSSDPWTIVVRAGEYAVVDAFACAAIEGRPYFAQTSFILYGQAKDAKNDRADFSEGPNWPEFNVRSNAEFYWPQTGHEFSVRFSGEEVNGLLEIHSGQGGLLDTVQASENGYTYTPPQDPALNRHGPTAAKPVVFVARTGEGGAASFTQMVHRSRFGAWNKKAGITVFTASVLLSALAVWLARKRFKACW